MEVGPYPEYSEAMIEVWLRVMPSYVTFGNPPSFPPRIWDMHQMGVTPEEFEDALWIGLANKSVPRRKVTAYSFGILRNRRADAEG